MDGFMNERKIKYTPLITTQQWVYTMPYISPLNYLYAIYMTMTNT